MKFLSFSCAVAICVVSFPVLAEGTDEVFVFNKMMPLPTAVSAELWCAELWCAEDGPVFATRRPFADGFIFAVRCPSNRQNFIEGLAFASTEDGADAKALLFPLPYADALAKDSLSNIRWSPETNEISEIVVDMEADDWCRTEATWLLAGSPIAAELTFYRHTKDCEGNNGWQMVVGEQS